MPAITNGRLQRFMLMLAATLPLFTQAQAATPREVESLTVTLLSTMLTEAGAGEWGFAALVEADGRRILFDTGHAEDTVWRNAEAMGIDLSGVTDVVLSHHHGDHSGGLTYLRSRFDELGSSALSRLHVGHGIFWDRAYAPGWRHMNVIRKDFEGSGGRVTEYDEPTELYPGVWLTGPVPRAHPERNYGNPFRPDQPLSESLVAPDGPRVDDIPESLSMVINTRKGLVVISGCGHAGMINILEYARQIVRPAGIHAAIGGFHLLHADDDRLRWTADKLRPLDLQNFIGAHCTGLEPVYRFRELLDLPRRNAVVGAVGARFSLDDGIDPLNLAR